MATKDDISLEESFEREERSEDTEDIDKDTQDQDNISLTVKIETPDQNSNQPNDEEKGKVTAVQDLNMQEDQANSVESLKILFANSLLKYIDKRTERGKTNFKWDGEPTQLKDFITLILKRNGQWKTRKAGTGKQMFIFQDKSANFTMNLDDGPEHLFINASFR